MSRRLRTLFASRIANLPAPTRQLLLLAALDGTGDLGVLRAATDSDRGLEDLQPAERARLVGIDQGTGGLVFRHPLVRSTVVDLSTDGERRRARRALADALVDQPERPGVAPGRGDTRVGRAGGRAARTCRPTEAAPG
jgi:hypothetical protein